MVPATSPSELVTTTLGNRPLVSINGNASPSRHSQQIQASTSQGGSGIMSSLKGGAGSLMKNIRDKSHSVIQTVQHSMATKGNKYILEVSYLALV